MLAQGVLFAGLTMLITSRTNFMKIPRQVSLPLLLVDFPAWTRRCAVCLAIMNERWSHTLLAKLTCQFEVLADSTHRIISTALLEQPNIETQQVRHTETWGDSRSVKSAVQNLRVANSWQDLLCQVFFTSASVWFARCIDIVARTTCREARTLQQVVNASNDLHGEPAGYLDLPLMASDARSYCIFDHGSWSL